MIEIIYSPASIEDLSHLYQDIRDDYGVLTAIDIMRKVTKQIKRLEYFPQSGRRLNELIQYPTSYRLMYTEKNYIIYRLDNSYIKIIRILHERQDYLTKLNIELSLNSIDEE